MSKKFSLIVLLVVFAFILTSCVQPGINLEVKPDPLEFSKDELEKEVTVKVTVEGFGEVTVDDITVLIESDTTDNPLSDFKEVITVNETFPAVQGIAKEETRTINLEDLWYEYELYKEYDEIDETDFDIFYDEYLAGNKFDLKVKLDGSVSSTTSVDMIFE